MNTSLKNPGLRRWRQAAGLSLIELSDLTGISVGHLSRVERGERHLSAMGKVNVARSLGVRLNFRISTRKVKPGNRYARGRPWRGAVQGSELSRAKLSRSVNSSGRRCSPDRQGCPSSGEPKDLLTAPSRSGSTLDLSGSI